MDPLKCPKCGSLNIRKETNFASKFISEDHKHKPHAAPNVCLEENCGYEWFDEEII